MLEIVLLTGLTQRIGALAAEKGRARTPYQWLFVLLWLGGEVSGLLFGLQVGSADQCAAYLFALLGAAAGAAIAFGIVNSLSPLSPADLATHSTVGVDR